MLDIKSRLLVVLLSRIMILTIITIMEIDTLICTSIHDMYNFL